MNDDYLKSYTNDCRMKKETQKKKKNDKENGYHREKEEIVAALKFVLFPIYFLTITIITYLQVAS